MSRPQRLPLDAQKHREEYMAILKREIENDQLNLNANRLFTKTGQTNLGKPVDIRTATEKDQGTELNKVSLRELLKKVTSTDSASQIVQQLSNDQVRFALNKWPIIEKELKETYALGVPSNVFVAYLNKLIEKYEDAIQVETGLQTTTNLLTNTQLAMDLAQPETISQLRLALEEAKKYFDTGTIRGRLDEMLGLLMTPEDIAFYNTLPPEVRATTDVLRTDAYEEFPSNRQLLISLQLLREGLVQEERETVRQALVELDQLLESANSNFPIIERMRAVIEEYRVSQEEAPERPETLAQVLDDKAQEEQEYLVKMRADAIARRKAKIAEDRTEAQRTLLQEQRQQKEQERAVKREAMQKQVEERRMRSEAKEQGFMGGEDKRLQTQELVAELARPKAKKPKAMPSMKAERQVMGAEDRPPLAVRQAEEELTPDQFDKLKKKDKEVVMRDLILKDPDLIFTLRDRTGRDVQRGVNSPQKATSFASFTVPELNSAYRQYKGSTGKGIKIPKQGRAEDLIEGGKIQWDKPNMSSKGKIMGHGIGHLVEKKAEKPKLYTPFGRYYIQKMKLDDNILQFKSHSGLQPNELPTERVSKQLANVIHTFLRETPNFEEINQLNEQDKRKLASICKKCHIMSPAVPKLKTLTDQEDDRFEVLRGQLIAGQDNLQLAKEFKVLMLKMVNEGRLPKRQANEIMHEMLMLGL